MLMSSRPTATTRGMSAGSASNTVFRPLRVAGRGHQPAGLVVEPEPGALARRQRRAVDDDTVAVGDVDRRRRQRPPVDLDPALCDPAFGVAARADAGARQHLGDAFARRRGRGSGFGHGPVHSKARGGWRGEGGAPPPSPRHPPPALLCTGPWPNPDPRLRRRASASPRCWRAPASARAATPRRWIAEGRVDVNGRTLTSPALNVTDRDRITVDGEPLPDARAHAALALQQAGGPGDDRTRPGGPQDRVRRAARRPAAGGDRRPARHQHRRPAAADQ